MVGYYDFHKMLKDRSIFQGWFDSTAAESQMKDFKQTIPAPSLLNTILWAQKLKILKLNIFIKELIMYDVDIWSV